MIMKSISSFNKIFYSFFLFIAALLIFRMLYAGSTRYLFMGWNLFLAWIPYALSSFFRQYQLSQKWKQAVLFMSWLLFFPNALYIVTDFVHLQYESDMPWWYDAVLLFASSFMGIVLAFISLRRAEVYLQGLFSPRQVNFLMAFILFLGSFGVYLGRFQRWNSWDVLHNPVSLAMDILTKLINPLDNYKVWAITILFTAIYSLLYYFIRLLPQALAETKNTDS